MPTKSSVAMTAKWAENIKPPAKGRIDYFDSRQQGLVLRVSESGRKAWGIIFRVKGDRRVRRMTLDPFPAMSLAEAREQAMQVMTAAVRGNDPATLKQDEKSSPTFGAVAKEYLERHASQKRSGHEDRRILQKDVLPLWGRRKATDIKRRDVIQLLDAINDRGAPIGANRTLALVRKLFNWAISRDLVEANPCAQVKPVAKENRRDRALTRDEIAALWNGLDHAGMADTTRNILRLILATAQRAGEVAGAEWDEIDIATRIWTIPAEKSKNGLAHRVPLNDPALDVIHSLPKGDGYLFPSPRQGKHVAVEALSHAVKKNLDKLGIAHFTPHDLRRTVATHMSEAGIQRLTLKKILNHAEGDVTATYDRHGYDREKRVALDDWGRRLKELIAASQPS